MIALKQSHLHDIRVIGHESRSLRAVIHYNKSNPINRFAEPGKQCRNGTRKHMLSCHLLSLSRFPVNDLLIKRVSLSGRFWDEKTVPGVWQANDENNRWIISQWILISAIQRMQSGERYLCLWYHGSVVIRRGPTVPRSHHRVDIWAPERPWSYADVIAVTTDWLWKACWSTGPLSLPTCQHILMHARTCVHARSHVLIVSGSCTKRCIAIHTHVHFPILILKRIHEEPDTWQDCKPGIVF